MEEEQEQKSVPMQGGGGTSGSAAAPEAAAAVSDIPGGQACKDDGTAQFKRADYKGAVASYSAGLAKLGRISSLEGEGISLCVRHWPPACPSATPATCPRRILAHLTPLHPPPHSLSPLTSTICPGCCRAAALYSNRAAALMMLKHFSSASADCAESLALEPGSSKVMLRKARCDLALGECERSIQLLSEVLEEDPGNATARSERTQAQAAVRAMGELRGALGEGSHARVVELTGSSLMDKCPASLFIRQARASALLAVGRTEEALALVTALLQGASDEGEGGAGVSSLLLLRARCLNYQGNGASAIKTLTECLRQDPDDPVAAKLMKLIKRSEALKKEGNDAYGAGKYEAALEAYRAALALDPANRNFASRLLANCAAVLLKQNKGSEAVGECNAAIEADDTYVKAYLRRAAAYMSMADADSVSSAIRDYSKAKELLGGMPGVAPGGGRQGPAGALALAQQQQQQQQPRQRARSC